MALSHAPGVLAKSALSRGENPVSKFQRGVFVIPAQAGIYSNILSVSSKALCALVAFRGVVAMDTGGPMHR